MRSEMNNLEKSNNRKGSFAECIDCIQEINQAAYEMSDLIHDLLDVGSSTSGSFSVDLDQKINIANAIKRSVKLNCDYALRRSISLKTEISSDPNLIRLDEKRVKQILVNLISNAIKYSPEKTEIKISAQNIFENEQKYLLIIVADQGFGMTLDQIDLAFQKYQTIKNPNSGKVDSFGLGMPIVKQLVELQNGTIEIKSELNKGTAIELKFPHLM